MKKFSKSIKEIITRIFITIFIIIFVYALYISNPSALQHTERMIYDVFLRWNGGGDPHPAPALIDLDEESMAEFGQWPWPRHLLGKLITKLRDKGAASIGLDIILAESDSSSLINIQKSFSHHFDLNIPLDNIPNNLYDNDLILSEIIAKSPIVLGSYATFTGKKTKLPKDLPKNEGLSNYYKAGSPNPQSLLIEADGIVLPLPEFRSHAKLGVINISPDPDGIIRSIPLLLKVDERIFFSLALQTLMQGLRANTIGLIGGVNGLQYIRLGQFMIPVSPNGRFMIPFRGSRNYYPTFRAADILNDKIPASEIQSRVFIIGTSAAGLRDIRSTPYDFDYPGAEVHATVIDAILSDRNIQIPHALKKIQGAIIVISGIITLIILSICPPLIYLPVLIALTIGCFFTSWHIFLEGMFINPQFAIITMISLALTLFGLRFWQESKQKRTLRNAFSRYIAPDMVRRIVEKGDVVLVGEERNITLMFTDIRGFTAMSENLNPIQVVDLLNQYFTPMTSIIKNNQGTVDKFIGDAIMAFWNAPLDIQMHELKAVFSGVKMLAALEKLNEKLVEELDIRLNMGIGIHTGKVYVGNMGSPEMLDYTCIGDNVNLASRLESLCPTYGVKLILSAETVNICKNYLENQPSLQEQFPLFLALDKIKVKGKEEAVEIYTVLEHDQINENEINLFSRGKSYYFNGDFTKASNVFQELLQNKPDNLTYQLFSVRCLELKNNPPVNWQGVWTFSKK